jgi:predicted Zn-dependent protease
MPLERDDQRYLTAAEGFTELGMCVDASEELEKIDPFCRQLPEVLVVRMRIYSTLQKWDLMQAVAKKLVEYDPDEVPPWISLAYATRRIESIDAAKKILLEALTRHTKEPVFHFNLACYECQLGDLTAAKS